MHTLLMKETCVCTAQPSGLCLEQFSQSLFHFRGLKICQTGEDVRNTGSRNSSHVSKTEVAALAPAVHAADRGGHSRVIEKVTARVLSSSAFDLRVINRIIRRNSGKS